MVGLLERIGDRVASHFQAPGDRILLLGTTTGALGGSAYWTEVRNFIGGTPPPVDLAAERALQRFLVAAAKARLLRSAHDCSDGGLAVALAEAAIGGPYAGHGRSAPGSISAPTAPEPQRMDCCSARTAPARS